MRRFGWPVAPAVIGLILGPVAETNLRRALAISNGDLSTLVDSWFSRVVFLVALLAIAGAADPPGRPPPRSRPPPPRVSPSARNVLTV